VKQRPLGKTGLIVSELSLGTWGLSGDGYGPVPEEDAERVIRRAVDLGINLFDTSDAYGAGKMEALLGRALEKNKDAIIVTKGGIDRTLSPPKRKFEGEYIRASVERSLRRLRRDCIDVYMLHNPSADAIFVGDAQSVLEDLKHSGKIRHWGVSAGDFDSTHAAIDRGAEVVELAYNLFEFRTLHRLSGDIMVNRTGIMARSTLAYGLFAGEWSAEKEFPTGDHRADRWTKMDLEQRIAQLKSVKFLVKGDVKSMRAAALRYVLANHVVSSAVLGPKSEHQLDQLIRESGGGPRYLPDHDLIELHKALDKAGIHYE